MRLLRRGGRDLAKWRRGVPAMRYPTNDTTMTEPTRIDRILGDCGHGGAYLARANATRNVGWWCHACTRWVSREMGSTTLWLPHSHPDLADKSVDDLPVIGERLYRRCQWCQQATFCELHHWFPLKFFGEAADRGPLGYLCKPCHDLWHTVLTPGLCTAYNAAAHLKHLVSYLRPESVLDLGRALFLYCKRSVGAA